jgi:hypothetical protein
MEMLALSRGDVGVMCVSVPVGSHSLSIGQECLNTEDEHAMAQARLAQLNHLPLINPSKLGWLFFYHTRLWKRPRFLLKNLCITTLSSQPQSQSQNCHGYVQVSIPFLICSISE